MRVENDWTDRKLRNGLHYPKSGVKCQYFDATNLGEHGKSTLGLVPSPLEACKLGKGRTNWYV